MSDSSEEIHVAVRAALVADADVSAVLGDRVRDAAPEGTEFPYAQITVEIGEPYDEIGSGGWEAVVRLDIWSRKTGQSGLLYAAARACKAVLHNGSLNLSSHTLVNCRMLPGGQRILRDQDQVTTHAMQRYRIVTCK